MIPNMADLIQNAGRAPHGARGLKYNDLLSLKDAREDALRMERVD